MIVNDGASAFELQGAEFSLFRNGYLKGGWRARLKVSPQKNHRYLALDKDAKQLRLLRRYAEMCPQPAAGTISNL